MNIQWIFSVMAVWLVVPWAFGQSTERFERVAKEYGWEAWKGTNATQYVNRLPSWHIPSLKIDAGGRKVEMVKEVRSERELNDVILDGRPVCRIESVVCPDVISAQRRLVQEFSKMTIRSKFDVLSFGDRGYGLAEGMSWRFALFARNNVFVSVMSHDRVTAWGGGKRGKDKLRSAWLPRPFRRMPKAWPTPIHYSPSYMRGCTPIQKVV